MLFCCPIGWTQSRRGSRIWEGWRHTKDLRRPGTFQRMPRMAATGLPKLDHFYPACVGLHLAHRRGTLDVQNLRDKLNRQTGMYRYARTISDAGAQKLVQQVCGPAHQCAKRILWRIDAETPLEDSEASRFMGVPGEIPESEAIPLLCREACNHFVAECRKAAKAEFESKDG